MDERGDPGLKDFGTELQDSWESLKDFTRKDVPRITRNILRASVIYYMLPLKGIFSKEDIMSAHFEHAQHKRLFKNLCSWSFLLVPSTFLKICEWVSMSSIRLSIVISPIKLHMINFVFWAGGTSFYISVYAVIWIFFLMLQIRQYQIFARKLMFYQCWKQNQIHLSFPASSWKSNNRDIGGWGNASTKSEYYDGLASPSL